jgi:hypothetical protein
MAQKDGEPERDIAMNKHLKTGNFNGYLTIKK